MKNTFRLLYLNLLFGVLFIGTLSSCTNNHADNQPSNLKIPGIFSDYMVLQRNSKVPVWGTANSGSKIAVSINGQTQSAITNNSGNWKVYLNNLTAGGPYEMTISGGSESVTFTDVLVGEVLLGSGQSNMEVAVEKPSDNPKKWVTDQETQDLVGDGNFPDIRISAATRDNLKTPNGSWLPLSSEIRDQLPALMACLAIDLHKQLKVPVGILLRAISSSPSGAWVSREAIGQNPEAQKELSDYTGFYPQLMEMYQNAMDEYEKIKDLNDLSNIETPEMKKYWAALKEWDINMYMNFRKGKQPKLPPEPGMERQSWFQKNKDSKGTHFERLIKPVMPYGINCIVWDQGEAGTGIAGVKQFTLMKILISDWRKGFDKDNIPFVYIRKNQYPDDFEVNMNTISETYMVDNRGLSQELHPRDKAAYARRVMLTLMDKVYK